MNKFLEEKEKLLNSVENNTPKHWKEYYKDVPLDCIFEDLVIDINEIKRLTEENQELKEQLEQKEDIINKAIKFVKDYKTEWTLNDEVLNDMNKLLEILDNKGE